MEQEFINKIKKLIAMKGNPILIQYSDEYDKEIFIDKPNVICQSLQDVRFDSNSIVINEKNSKCRGGSYFLGLSEYNPKLLNFWVNIEKSHKSVSACVEFINNLNPIPSNIASNVLLSASLHVISKPDLIIFISNAEGISRLLGICNYAFGNSNRISSYSAACSAAIGIPMGKNSMNVSFIDNSARKIADFDDNELMITIPANQLLLINDAIDNCIWGGVAEVPYLSIETKLCGSWIRPDKRR